MRIAPLKAADKPAWLTLWGGYQAFYETDLTDVTATTWTRLLEPSEPLHGALATVDGTAAGLVHWVIHRSTWTIANTCYLQDLFVTPTHRGSGAGRALITHATHAAQTAGCADIYWLTHETNTTAMRLYDRMATKTGFLQYQRLLPHNQSDAA
jgi:GNAT superfamily N-acetyltransferase